MNTMQFKLSTGMFVITHLWTFVHNEKSERPSLLVFNAEENQDWQQIYKY